MSVSGLIQIQVPDAIYADSTRADQVLLTLAGLYLHYKAHAESEVSIDLVVRLEKRWKDCDQPLFLVALILNPFEGLSCFGPRAKFDHFKAANIVVELRCHKFIDASQVIPATGIPLKSGKPRRRALLNQCLSTCHVPVSSRVGPWHATRSKKQWEMTHWLSLLAAFAITVLKVVVNQAGCERVFSDLKNRESPRRSRTGLAKLEKLTKINSGIKAEHVADGILPQNRQKRKNHKSAETLLCVPRYRDLLENQADKGEGEWGGAFITSTAEWRVELAEWIAETREAEEDEEESEAEEASDAESPPTASTSGSKSQKWRKTSLSVLFGGAPRPATKVDADDLEHEAELMEALVRNAEADAEEDARLDDGEIEDDTDVYIP
ncbi:hypothetical protein C8F04DRAFT_1295245 [Mycena alexandri]|uniref:HAT C-terminal dimerisation domain-containing protein n=1 Tax=Mycena alexandri TaxID=1745969 RepID=A0AAD6TBD9_9AGAR|nr:hypothetical protein C8F04DRAFT_1295245 [Mycena alexandri]